MSMYRHAALRLPCERCAAEHPRHALVLSPSGSGHVCWRCQLRAQIAEHERESRASHAPWRSTPRLAARPTATPRLMGALGIFAIAVMCALALMAVLALATLFGHWC